MCRSRSGAMTGSARCAWRPSAARWRGRSATPGSAPWTATSCPATPAGALRPLLQARRGDAGCQFAMLVGVVRVRQRFRAVHPTGGIRGSTLSAASQCCWLPPQYLAVPIFKAASCRCTQGSSAYWTTFTRTWCPVRAALHIISTCMAASILQSAIRGRSPFCR